MEMNQRRNRRFPTDATCFAALQDNDTSVGVLHDISLEGLAFESVKPENSIMEGFQVDIFCTDDDYYLTNIPCKVVYSREQQSRNKDHSRPQELPTVRCGIKFIHLEEFQKKELQSLIESQMLLSS